MPQSLTRVVDILSYLLHSGSWVSLVFLKSVIILHPPERYLYHSIPYFSNSLFV